MRHLVLPREHPVLLRDRDDPAGALQAVRRIAGAAPRLPRARADHNRARSPGGRAPAGGIDRPLIASGALPADRRLAGASARAPDVDAHPLAPRSGRDSTGAAGRRGPDVGRPVDDRAARAPGAPGGNGAGAPAVHCPPGVPMRVATAFESHHTDPESARPSARATDDREPQSLGRLAGARGDAGRAERRCAAVRGRADESRDGRGGTLRPERGASDAAGSASGSPRPGRARATHRADRSGNRTRVLIPSVGGDHRIDGGGSSPRPSLA